MCHAKTTKGSQLSLDAIEEVLSPFFKPAAPAAASPEAAAAAAAIRGESTQAPERQTDQHLHHQAMSNPRGGSSPKGGATGGVHQTEAAVDPCSKKAAAAMPSIPPEAITRSEVADEMPQPPAREGKRPTKKIRFTGALGEFLDGGGVWNDFAEMEAERKAELNLHQQQQQQRPEQKLQQRRHHDSPQQQHDTKLQVGDQKQERRGEEVGKAEGGGKKEQEEQEGNGGGGAGRKSGGGGEAAAPHQEGNDGWKTPTAVVADRDLSAAAPLPPADTTSTNTVCGSSSPPER
ncbi:unnamed protein product [Scytosiphon promiscuus]